MDGAEELAVVILAGGESTRLPGKLESDAGGVPLLVRVYRNVRDAGPVVISANRTFPPEIDAELACPIVVDKKPGRGPLGGLVSAFEYVRTPRVFVAAGDAPFIDNSCVRELLEQWEDGIEAVVPVNGAGRLEPLCALYDRAAFLTAAGAVLACGSGGPAAVAEHLRTKRVRLSDERVFANVNTASDRRALFRVKNLAS